MGRYSDNIFTCEICNDEVNDNDEQKYITITREGNNSRDFCLCKHCFDDLIDYKKIKKIKKDKNDYNYKLLKPFTYLSLQDTEFNL
jgi:hypothetical protein